MCVGSPTAVLARHRGRLQPRRWDAATACTAPACLLQPATNGHEYVHKVVCRGLKCRILVVCRRVGLLGQLKVDAACCASSACSVRPGDPGPCSTLLLLTAPTGSPQGAFCLQCQHVPLLIDSVCLE